MKKMSINVLSTLRQLLWDPLRKAVENVAIVWRYWQPVTDHQTVNIKALKPVNFGGFIRFLCKPRAEIKYYGKIGPDPGSIFICSSTSSLCGIYKCHLFGKNIAVFRLHQWFPEFEQESDSWICKISNPDTDARKKFWNWRGVRKCDTAWPLLKNAKTRIKVVVPLLVFFH